jgi:hypothetical protein
MNTLAMKPSHKPSAAAIMVPTAPVFLTHVPSLMFVGFY